MTVQARTAARWMMVAAAALTMTACASRRPPTALPDPMGDQAAAEAAAAAAAGGAGAAPAGGFGEGGMAPMTSGAAASGPGSLQDFVVSAGDRVYFETDQHELRAEAIPVLDAQAQWLTRYPNVRVIIEGNADERGTREYNLALGARRAQAVAEHLVGRGVSGSRISTISYGKERPIAEGSDESAWAKNRNARTNFQGNEP